MDNPTQALVDETLVDMAAHLHMGADEQGQLGRGWHDAAGRVHHDRRMSRKRPAPLNRLQRMQAIDAERERRLKPLVWILCVLGVCAFWAGVILGIMWLKGML